MKSSNSNEPGYRLKVSAFDRVLSVLLSLVSLLSASVLTLFVVWLAVELPEVGPTPPPPPPPEVTWGTFSPSAEWERVDFAPLKGDEADLSIAPTVLLLADVGKVVGEKGVEGIDGDDPEGPITKDPWKPPGPQWRFRFPHNLTLKQYAGLLGHFEIELGVLERGGKVRYASDLTKLKPATRIGPSAQENRYYLTWVDGDLQKADASLLRRAGISPGRRLVLKFLPSELEATLRQLSKQQQEIDQRVGDKIRRTDFAVRTTGSGTYEFFVVAQYYR